MLNEHEPLVINAIGHMAGAIIFGIFLVLALRATSGRRTRQGLLSVASAGLALLWNAGSFTMLLLPAGSLRWSVEAVSFCSLSLLPAVLLHLSLNRHFHGVALGGYCLSIAATAMHLLEGIQPGLHLHKWALWLITVGFSVVTTVYAVAVLRDGREMRGRASQILTSMCLLLFAVTFSHFGSGHPPQPWKELVVHHAGIPLALLILLQDYRFIFLDAFVRFLANVILAAVLSFLAIRFAAELASESALAHPLADVFAAAGLCVLLVLFAYLRGIVQRLLTKAIFRSGAAAAVVQELRAKSAEVRDEEAFLNWVANRLAAFIRTADSEWLTFAEAGISNLDYPVLADQEPWLARDPRFNWAEAVVPVRLAQGDIRYLLLGRRHGGRRYLSEDLRSLNHLSSIVSDEVDRFRAAEMQRLVAEAELRALHSQINPHFLFNALNTIYGIIPREAAGARRTVLNLAEIFRYFLQSEKVLIPLSEEVKIVKAYLEIERLRLGPRLETLIDVDKAAEQTLIPVLSIQPLVENAIKHGLSRRSGEGWLKLTAHLAHGSVEIAVEDFAASPAADLPEAPAGAGVGLANVSRRLQLCFGPEVELKMKRSDYGARVQFSVPVSNGTASLRALARGRAG